MLNNLKNKIHRFLIWSQKYTQTDNIYLFRGGFWLILGQIIWTAASFLLAMAFANLLDPATYGNYKYILSLVGILSIFSLGGINVAVTQAAARGLESSFYAGFQTKFKWSLLGSLVAIGAAIYYFVQGNELLPIPLLILAIFFPLMQASRIYGNFLEGKKLFDIETKYGMASQIIFVGAMITTLFLTKNLFWLIAAYFVSNTFLNYFFYLRTKFKLQPNKKEDPQTISFGKHLTLIGILDRGSKEIDKVLLFTFIGPVELAVYSFAILIPNQIAATLANIKVLALPKLAAKSREEIKKNLMKKVRKLFIFVGAIIAVYIVAAPYIYKIFFPKYLASVPYSQLFILYLITIPFDLLSIFFQAKMMKKEIYLLRITGIVRLTLFAVLIPIWGIWGAILAMTGTQVFRAAFLFFLFRLSLRKQ